MMKITSDNLEEILFHDLGKIFKVLSLKEKEILSMRIGLHKTAVNGKMTLEQVGREFDVTRERIRQIESKALEKLKIVLKYEVK